MKSKKLIGVCLIFGLLIFFVKPLLDVFLWRKEYEDLDIVNLIFLSLFSSVFMGVLIKYKVVKTKGIV